MGDMPVFCARIFGVNFCIGPAIETHRGGSRENNGDDNPKDLLPRRKTACSNQHRAEREGEGEDRMGEFDHLESVMDFLEHK